MDEVEILCETCGVFYHTLLYNEHVASHDHNVIFHDTFTFRESAAQCRIVTLSTGNPNNILGVEDYLESIRNIVIYWINFYQRMHKSIKYNLMLECKFYKDGAYQIRSFKTANAIVYQLTNVNEQYSSDILKIINEKHDLEQRGSGWSLSSVERLELRINRYEPMTGGSLLSRFKMPEFLRKKKCIVNPYKFNNLQNCGECCRNLCFKFSVLGKPLFDAGINVHNIRNYFKYIHINNRYNWECVSFPVNIDSVSVFEQHNDISINIYGVDSISNRVYPLKVTNTRKSDHRDILYYKNHYCWIKNFESLVTSQVLKRQRTHLYVCRQCFRCFYKEDYLLNHEKNCLNNFDNLQTLQIPKTGFKSISFKNYGRQLKIPYVIYADITYKFNPEFSCEPNPDTSYTQRLGVYDIKKCMYCVVFNGKIRDIKEFTNIISFMKSLERECRRINERYKINTPMKGPLPEKPSSDDLCHICGKPLDNDYVLDHDHTNGVIRGYAHSICNINFRLPSFVPVIMKNFSKFNSTLILKYIFETYTEKKNVNVIPCSENNLNRFILIAYNYFGVKIKFIDQCKFVDLHETLDFITNVKKFEMVRNICLKHYKLDLAHYISIGAYSWDAMLKITDVKLDLLTDLEMYNMIKRGIRGGLVQCVKRYAKTNSEKYPQTYDSTQPESHIYYFDIINLYGKVMMDYPLPHSNYSWVEKLENINIFENIEEGVGYIFEVDLEYPENLKFHHLDYPLCPHFIEDCGLVASLRNKYNYVIHHVALRQALKMGLLVTTIHRVIKFKESTWLAPYIRLNTSLRQQYSNEKFLSNVFKLQSNIIYGKSIEKIENRSNVYILKSNTKKLMKLIKQQNFLDRTIIDENTYIVYSYKRKCRITKPITVGMSILDLSKSYMYDLYYNELKIRLPPFELLYTDTDSFLIQIFYSGDISTRLRDCSDLFYLGNDIGPIGFFRDQSLNNPISEYVGLRCKVYGYKCVDSKTNLKNLPYGVHFSKYIQMLLNETRMLTTNNYSRLIGDKFSKLCVNKNVPLASGDRKRIICPDRIHTLPLV